MALKGLVERILWRLMMSVQEQVDKNNVD